MTDKCFNALRKIAAAGPKADWWDKEIIPEMEQNRRPNPTGLRANYNSTKKLTPPAGYKGNMPQNPSQNPPQNKNHNEELYEQLRQLDKQRKNMSKSAAAPRTPAPRVRYTRHILKPGQSLWSAYKQYNPKGEVPWDLQAILNKNNTTEEGAKRYRPGQTVYVPIGNDVVDPNASPEAREAQVDWMNQTNEPIPAELDQ